MLIDNPNSLPWAFGLSLICCAIPFYLYNKGLEILEASKAAIISCVEPMVGTLTGIMIFHEDCSKLKLLGIASIIISVMLLNSERLDLNNDRNIENVNE